MDPSAAHAALDRVARALDAPARRIVHDDGADADRADEVLGALEALHDLRSALLAWEPELIETAREQGVSWARLAPAVGVATRQAAERRYLRLRPSDDAALTREQRVQAIRDERAGDRAVAAWARANASELRQVAGRASAAPGFLGSGRRRARTLASSLTEDDPAALIDPLADLHTDLVDRHAELAAEVDSIRRRVSRVRRDTQRRRDTTAQS